MSQDTLMLYKLMVLYMLNKVEFPNFRIYPGQGLYELFHPSAGTS